ncbi:MAG: hypothetical protein AAF357_04970 [Verrucomicrobiota bacterium]
MEPNRIEYIAPTKRAFERMKDILFRPFSIQKWFILGFSAWLATLGEGGGSSGGGGGGDSDLGSEEESLSSMLEGFTAWIQENIALIVTIGAILIAIILIISVVVLWIQSRGKFMFLDNIVHDRTLISEPWKEFRVVANSLFLWKLAFGLILTLFLAALGGWSIYLAWPMLESEAFDSSTIPIFVIIGSLFLILILAFSYIGNLLENFVIPLMHREGIPTNAAWRKFLSLHHSRTGSFVLFFLWMIVIGFATGIAILLLVLCTCCIAAIPLIIPYLGTVLLLPIYVFMRLIGPEFLRQFGEEFDTLTTASKPPLPLN